MMDKPQPFFEECISRRPVFNAYLGNNPKCEMIPWTHVDTGTTDYGESCPSLVVFLENLPQTGIWHLSAIVYDSDDCELISFKSDVLSIEINIEKIWYLESPLIDPSRVNICINQEAISFHETVSLHQYLLSGRVTDFAGNPIRSIVHAVGLEGVTTMTDEDGNYDLWLPSIHIRALQAYDAGYGKTSLECWIYDYTPKEDLRLDLRIGQFEIYELRAWRGFLGVKMDFLPMSLFCVLSALADNDTQGRYAPVLMPEDIKVILDGIEVPLLSVDKRKEMLSGNESIDQRDEYSFHVSDRELLPGNKGSLQVLQIVLQHKYEESEIIEQGEGFFLGLRNGVSINGGMSF
ncbi:MAG: carboxypeptidase-like regulatory domain-containing protein [Armatimonadota bacterium]